MLYVRQIVKALDKQIEYLVSTKYAITSFQSIVWMLIPVIVTIYRNIAVSSQRYQGSHSIVLTNN